MNNEEELKKIYKDIDESMKFTGVPKIFVDGGTNIGKISIIKVKQPDRFMMWCKYHWFRLTRPKEHKEIVRLVASIQDAQLAYFKDIFSDHK